jgi:hypothetical protein
METLQRTLSYPIESPYKVHRLNGYYPRKENYVSGLIG